MSAVKADPWNVHDQVSEEFAKRRKYGRTPLTDAAARLCLTMIDAMTLTALRDAWDSVSTARKAEMISDDEYRALAEEKDVCKRRIELLGDSQARLTDDDSASTCDALITPKGGN